MTTTGGIVEVLYSFDLGGSEILGARLAIALRRRGITITCISVHHYDGPVRRQLEAEGIECVGFGFNNRSRLGRFRGQLELHRWFLGRRPEIVHCQHALTLIRCLRPARSAKARKIMMTEHTEAPYEVMLRYRIRTMLAIRRIQCVVVIHEELRKYFIEKMLASAARVVVIPNGVPVPGMNCEGVLHHRQSSQCDPFVCLFVGRLHRDKDVPTLLRALDQVRCTLRERSVQLLIVGDGPERASLEEMVRKLALTSNVTFVGAQSNPPLFMERANVFVMSSVTEGIPLALLEAMAFGLPCIATAVGGIPGVLSGGRGVLVAAGDHSSLARAIVELARSDELASSIAHSARKAIELEYSIDVMVDRYLELFGLAGKTSDGTASRPSLSVSGESGGTTERGAQ